MEKSPIAAFAVGTFLFTAFSNSWGLMESKQTRDSDPKTRLKIDEEEFQEKYDLTDYNVWQNRDLFDRAVKICTKQAHKAQPINDKFIHKMRLKLGLAA